MKDLVCVGVSSGSAEAADLAAILESKLGYRFRVERVGPGFGVFLIGRSSQEDVQRAFDVAFGYQRGSDRIAKC